MRLFVALAILLAGTLPAFGYQADQQNTKSEKRVLRNADFQRPTRPDAINNADLQKQPRTDAITNADLERVETEHKGRDLTDYSRRSRVTRPRRVEPEEQTTTTIRNVSLNKRQTTSSEKRLLNRKQVLESRIADLENELNELQQRVLQNRPLNPNKVGDPYYVDPNMRKKVTTLKTQLEKAQVEYQQIVEKLDKSY